jgi:hypothetical protein
VQTFIITRAGASSVAEIACAGRPAIFIPFAKAMDNHQQANAEQLCAHKGGLLLAEAGLEASELSQRIATLMEDKGLRLEMAKNASACAKKDAAAMITDHLLSYRDCPEQGGRMTALPLSIGRIHFTGIGGIGMSGIAEILHELGYQVQGSDIAESANVRRLRARGIEVSIPQKEENLEGVSIVVISTAIKPDNPELVAARTRYLPVVHRAEMLGELMRLRWSVAGSRHAWQNDNHVAGSDFARRRWH